MQDRTCPVCGTQHSRRGIYCAETCSKRAENARRRGTTPRPPIASFNCKRCGNTCVPGKGVPAHASHFCSKPCRKAWHRLYGVGMPSKQERAQRTLDRAAAGTRGTTTWYDRLCPECGARTLSHHVPRDDNGYCSATCCLKQKRRRRRARQAGAGSKTLSFRQVAERDGWVCALCSKDVDPTLLVPHPHAATLDHVLPLARGGTHTMDNAQLAHFICNSVKRDIVSR